MRAKIFAILFFFLWVVPVTQILSEVEAFAQYVDTAWVRRYNGPGNYDDGASAIAVDGSGNVYVTGCSYGSGTYYDYATIKYYPYGDTTWVRRYNGPGNANDKARALAVDSSGNVYVTGYSASTSAYPYNFDIATLKYKADGDTDWVRRYNGPGNDYDGASAIAVDGSGNVYVTGSSQGIGTSADYTTIKYYSNGDTAWVRRYSTEYWDAAFAMAVDDSGNVYVTGYSYGNGADYTTIKYYPDGDTAWVRRYNGPGNSNDNAFAIAVDSSGNVYVTGLSYGSGTYQDYATIKYYPSGDTAWVRRYNGSGNFDDEAYAIAVDASGNVYVTGITSMFSGYDDYATVKYDQNGNEVWDRIYNGPVDSTDIPSRLTIDGSGNIYVTGRSIGSWTNYDYATIRYYTNGDTAWVRRYSCGLGLSSLDDEATAIAVDASGNVYVTGNGCGLTHGDYVTIKYVYDYLTDTLAVVAYSPVDLIVTDPKGDSIGIGFNPTIPGATYNDTIDLNADGDSDDVVIIPNRLVGDYKIRVVAEPEGTGYYDLGIRIDGSDWRYIVKQAACPPPGQVDTFTYYAPWYMRGDANGDWKINLSDVIYLANYILKGGPTPDPLESGDVNCDYKYDLVDVILLARYVLLGEPFPC